MISSKKTAPPLAQNVPANNIFALHERRNADVLLALETLLDEARSGRLTGVAFVAQIDGRDQPLSLTGSYVRDRFARFDLVCTLYDFVRDRLRT